jgi:excisionase family DNA binding protein
VEKGGDACWNRTWIISNFSGDNCLYRQFLHYECKTTFVNSVTKNQPIRRYSQIDELHSPKACQLLKGLSVMIAQDQKEAKVAHDEADLLTVREVAQQLRVDDTTVRRWIKNGVLEAITLPHRGTRQAYRIRRSTLNALLTPTERTASAQ